MRTVPRRAAGAGRSGRPVGGAGVRVVGLNTRDDERAARELLAKVDATDLPIVADPDGVTAASWGVRGMPETFVVDRNGWIAHHSRGR